MLVNLILIYLHAYKGHAKYTIAPMNTTSAVDKVVAAAASAAEVDVACGGGETVEGRRARVVSTGGSVVLSVLKVQPFGISTFEVRHAFRGSTHNWVLKLPIQRCQVDTVSSTLRVPFPLRIFPAV